MATVYVQRAPDGAVIGVFRAPQLGMAEEAIDDGAAEVVAFSDRPLPAPRDIAAELDDLKAVLIGKGAVTREEIDAEVIRSVKK